MGKDFKDEDVQLGHKKLEELKESLKSLKKHADGCHRTWAEEVSAARVKIQKDVFALKGVVASATGFSQFEKYESVHNFLNGPHNTRVSEAFGKTVAGPIEAWLQHIEHSEIELKNLEKQRSAFDHYTHKVEKLHAHVLERQMKGKSIDAKEHEKVQRNEEKLKFAAAEYNAARDRVVGHLLALFEDAGRRLDNLLVNIMRYEHIMFAEAASHTAEYMPEVEALERAAAGLEGTDNSRIEAWIAHARAAREQQRLVEYYSRLPSSAAGGSLGSPDSAGSDLIGPDDSASQVGQKLAAGIDVFGPGNPNPSVSGSASTVTASSSSSLTSASDVGSTASAASAGARRPSIKGPPAAVPKQVPASEWT